MWITRWQGSPICQRSHYNRSLHQESDAAAIRAVDKISELFDNASGFGRPSQQRGKDEFAATAHEGVASKLGLHL
jgi:hypothetical protein